MSGSVLTLFISTHCSLLSAAPLADVTASGMLRMTNLKPTAQVNLWEVTMLGFNLRFV